MVGYTDTNLYLFLNVNVKEKNSSSPIDGVSGACIVFKKEVQKFLSLCIHKLFTFQSFFHKPEDQIERNPREMLLGWSQIFWVICFPFVNSA